MWGGGTHPICGLPDSKVSSLVPVLFPLMMMIDVDDETGRPVHTFPHCYQVGMRGYLATRQMLLAGLDAVNINGGFRSWQTQFKTLYGPKL